MTWKSFLTAFVSSLLLALPQNMIGCGPDMDPYDYHTGFFLKNLSEYQVFRPFYYSSYTFLYDGFEEESQEEILAKEWADYCGGAVTADDAARLVFSTSLPSLKSLYAHAAKKKSLPRSDSLRKNSMALRLTANQDLEALGYLQYAKSVERFVTGSGDDWEPIVRDSVKMSRLIRSGVQLYQATKKDFFKLKYGYQVIRLAHYSGRYREAVTYYDRLVAHTTTRSILQQLSLSLKAGALYRSGNLQEGAYLFSKAFAASPVRRMSNYLGLLWASVNAYDRAPYLAYCKNDAEKANLLGMMSIFGSREEFASMKEVYRLDPASPILELMAVREVNKLEEIYYSPTLATQPGGDIMYYSWAEPITQDSLIQLEKRIHTMGDWFHEVARVNRVKNPALFELAASYLSMMLRDWPQSRERLDQAASLPMSQRHKDQMAMINLLLMVNSPEKLDAATEKKILPSLEWLKEKASEEKPIDELYRPYDKSQWVRFYRSIWAEIIARKYHQQHDMVREVMAVGAAEWIYNPSAESYWGIGFLRNHMSSTDVSALYDFIQSSQHSPFETFLIRNNSIIQKSVVDFAGTAYLRDQNYTEAIRWFELDPSAAGEIQKDPFIELLYDQSEHIRSNSANTSKIAFAKEMKRLQEAVALKDKNEAASLYKMALGLYNTTYYGYAWELVEYGRSGTDGYKIPKDATSFKKNYYGCFDAHDYFKRAMEASSDMEFRARCLFMMAKCKQKQWQQPQYNDYRNEEYSVYDKALNEYYKQFMNNPYFPQLTREYKNTKFFNEAFQSCSYLRDFVGESKK